MLRYLQAALAMSAAGTAAFLLALAGSRFCRPRGGYALRLAALGLFLLPVGLFLAPRAAAPAPNLAPIPAGSAPGFVAPPPSPGAFSPDVLGGAVGTSAPPFWEKPELWAALWLGGAALLLLLALLRRARLTRSRARLPLQKAPPAVERALREAAAGMGFVRPPTVSVCPGLATPMLVGLWHSRILLPEYELTREELLPILSHELQHSRQGDLWIWLFAELACCLHWWNPAVWILRRQLIRFGELACDEAVAMGLSPEKKRAYSHAILNVLAHVGPPGVDETRLPGVAPLSANGRAVKERLELIMNSKKTTKWAAALTLTLVLAVSAGGTLVARGLSPERPAPPASSARTALTSATSESWNFPLEGEGIVISAAYGDRPHHPFHHGVNYAYRDASGANVSQDKPIYAVKSGTVTSAGWKSGDGNYVEIDHGNGDSSRYAHCSKLLVKQGDAVKQGQNIATLGSSGNATGPCLYFELYLGGKRVDPALYLTIPSAGSAPESTPTSDGAAALPVNPSNVRLEFKTDPANRLAFYTNSSEPVYAVRGGTVIYADLLGSFGWQVQIRQDDGLVAVYSHLSGSKSDSKRTASGENSKLSIQGVPPLAVTEGQTVTAGEQIGDTGTSGNVTKPQCLFYLAREAPPQKGVVSNGLLGKSELAAYLGLSEGALQGGVS